MSPRNEQELLDQTIQLAMLNRWAVMHQRPARTRNGYRTAIQGHAGFPDLVLARRGQTLFRELKGPHGKLTPEQRDWARQLAPLWREDVEEDWRTSCRFDIWRPQDWVTLIVPTLTVSVSVDAAPWTP